MSDTKGSFAQVNYLLRPSKQVERKMIIEALQKLVPLGYNIPKYRYIGLGSIYYVDFLLFYKYLHIKDMLCVEKRPIGRRMRFNKPYEFVKLHMGRVSEILPSLNRTKPHFLWLDYDYPLNEEIVSDLSAAANVVAPGSVVIVTVTAQLAEVERAATLDQMQERSRIWAGKYSEWFGAYVEEVRPNMLTRRNLSSLFSQVVRNVLTDRAKERTDARLEFLQI